MNKPDNYAQIFAGVNNRFAYLKSRWMKGLISEGVKASHPDDGWVNKVKNEVKFCYPHFKQSISVGDLVALGDFSKYRLVKIDYIQKDIYGFHERSRHKGESL